VQSQDAGDGAQQGALARAVGAEECDDAAGRDGEGDAVQRADGLAVGHIEVLDVQGLRRDVGLGFSSGPRGAVRGK